LNAIAASAPAAMPVRTGYDSQKRSETCTIAHSSSQRLQERKIKKVKIVQTEGRGFGLALAEDAAPGDLIIEYCGEVIDDDELNRRLESHHASGYDIKG